MGSIWAQNVICSEVVEIDERLAIDDFALHTACADPFAPCMDRWPATRLEKILIGFCVRGKQHFTLSHEAADY
jgi:hypothetical protein